MSEQSTATEVTEHRMPVRTLVAASIGNAIEWYDWTIYATFSIFFATQIFPKENAALALISALATYALAFFFRPLGGWLLGPLRGPARPPDRDDADHRADGGRLAGHRPAADVRSGRLAGAGPAAAGPDRAGDVARRRGVQRLGLPGRDRARRQRRGRYSSFFYISTGSAVLLASLLGALLTAVLSKEELASYGWRIPFLIGGVLGLVGLWLRRAMPETEQFEENKAKAQALKHPLLTTLREHPKAVGQLVGFTLLSTLCYYTFFSALTPFAVSSRGADAGEVFVALSIATALFVALQYPMGLLADRFGRKPQLLVWSAATAVLVVPLSTLIGPGLGNLLVVFCVGLGLYTAMTSIAPAIMSELFPTELRGLGIGAWYNLTVALFGGTAPLVIQTLSGAGLADAFFWYVAAGAAIAFLVILTLPETRGSVLR